jgi:hypothetical protein
VKRVIPEEVRFYSWDQLMVAKVVERNKKKRGLVQIGFEVKVPLFMSALDRAQVLRDLKRRLMRMGAFPGQGNQCLEQGCVKLDCLF